MILSITLIPTLNAQVQDATSALPSTRSFPASSGFQDYSDSDVSYYGGELTLGKEKIYLEPDQMNPVIVDGRPRYYPDRVGVQWSVRIETETGKIWAVPSLYGIRAKHMSSQTSIPLQQLCERLGMVEPQLLLELGELVQICVPADDLSALDVLGVDHKITEAWIQKDKLETFKASLRSIFGL